MKKILLKTDIDCEKSKKKALQAIATINGVDSVSIDLKEKEIIVIGEADPISLTRKMRKFRSTEILSVGPARNEMRLRHWTRTEASNSAPSTTCHHCQGLPSASDDSPNACTIC